MFKVQKADRKDPLILAPNKCLTFWGTLFCRGLVCVGFFRPSENPNELERAYPPVNLIS